MFSHFCFTHLIQLEHSCNQLFPSLAAISLIISTLSFTPELKAVSNKHDFQFFFAFIFIFNRALLWKISNSTGMAHIWIPSFCHYCGGSKFWQIEFSPTLMFQCQVIALIENPILDQKFFSTSIFSSTVTFRDLVKWGCLIAWSFLYYLFLCCCFYARSHQNSFYSFMHL